MQNRLLSALSAALVLGGTACKESPVDPPAGEPGIRVVAGGVGADTIEALLPQALIVEVRNAQGLAPAGTAVRFEIRPLVDTAGRPNVRVQLCALTSTCAPDAFSSLTIANVDAQGRLAVQVRMGRVAGKALVRMSVPDLSFSDSVVDEIKLGNTARLRAGPTMIGVPIGTSALLGLGVVDRYGNGSAGGLSYTAGPGTAITVDAATGNATAREFGTQWVTVRQGTFADSVRVVAVPAGRLVVWGESDKVVRMIDINGNNNRVVATGVTGDLGVYPRFSASRQRISYHEATSAIIVGDTAGVTQADRVSFGGIAGGILATRHMSDGSTLFVATASGTGARYLYRSVGNQTPVQVAPIPDRTFTQGTADISPDGSKVAFVIGRELSILTVATGAVHKTGHDPVLHARWSPQGDKLVFLEGGNELVGKMILTDGNGNGRQEMSSEIFSAGFTWSPDGAYILGRDGTAPSAGFRIVRVSDRAEVLLKLFTATGTPLDYLQPDWR
ncbi:MAG: hypothetical protein ACO1Q7_20695 [Gemmatimonas sp.]